MTGIGNTQVNQGGQNNTLHFSPRLGPILNPIRSKLTAYWHSANCGDTPRNLHCRTKTSFSGQELTEFAIVVPLLVLIVFGALDLARGFFTAITITNAAREGARFGMSNVDDFAGVYSAVRREALNSGIDLSGASIAVNCTDAVTPPGCDSGYPIRVTVTHNFRLLMGWVLNRSTITMTRDIEMLVP